MEKISKEKPKWLGLQWVRGLAALLVVASHLSYWQNHGVYTDELGSQLLPRLGGLAVAVFFCLSGIVILLAHGREIGAAVSLRGRLLLGFWIKRAFRIYPAYWCFASANYLLFRLGYTTPDTYVGTLHSPLDFVKATALVTTRTPLAPAWSLSHELCFYAIFGLFLISRRIGTIAASLMLGLTAVSWLHIVPMAWLMLTPLNFLFLLGVILILCRDRFAKHARVWHLLGLLFWIPLWIAAGNHASPLFDPVNLMLCLIGVALLFLALLSEPNPAAPAVPRWFQGAGLGLGDISYALYLGHLPVQTLLYRIVGPPDDVIRIFLYLAVPLGVAWLAFRWIERPMIWVGREWTRRRLQRAPDGGLI